MKELIETIWNAPMWIILAMIFLPVGTVIAWLVYIFATINSKRKRNYIRMNKDFNDLRNRVRSELKKD